MGDIERVLRNYGAMVDRAARQWLEGIPTEYLAEPLRYHLGSGGKRLRPALCLHVCEQLGGSIDQAVPFALAVEILHNMFLIHDDIEDGDTMRRDEPAAWVKFGVPNALNAGDYLLAAAVQLALQGELPPELKLRLASLLVGTALRTIEGQALDINLRAAAEFSVDDYLRIARLKTGRYLVLGMAGAAVICGAPEAVVDQLWALGDLLGPAFQIRDDIIDLTQGKGRGGEIGCDIREGKPSILYAYALQHAGAAERERLIAVMAARREETSAADVGWVIDLYERLGAIEFARRYADERLAKAKDIIAKLPLSQRETLGRLTDYLIGRTT